MAKTGLRRLGIGVAVFAIAAVAVGLTAAGGSGDTAGGATLTTSADGSVSFTPDTATLSFGASSQRRTATAAVAANATAMNAIVAAIKAAGAHDVSTDAVSLGPAMNPGSSTIVGFWASNSVHGTIAVDQSPQLIDAAVGAGATNVSGLSFGSSGDLESMYRAALKAAIAQARARAAAMAAAAGVTLGPIVSISSTPNYATATAVPTAQPASGSSTPVLAPTEQVSASATLVFSVS
jgi:uncharacterized protein